MIFKEKEESHLTKAQLGQALSPKEPTPEPEPPPENIYDQIRRENREAQEKEAAVQKERVRVLDTLAPTSGARDPLAERMGMWR